MGKNDNTTTTLGYKTKIKEFVNDFGLPRLIIAGFLLALFILAPLVGADLPTQITNTINRFSWNAVLVLAMVDVYKRQTLRMTMSMRLWRMPLTSF